MVVNLTFAELHEYVAKHYNKDLGLSYLASNALTVTFTKKVVIADLKVSIDLYIDAVATAEVTLSYKGILAKDIITAGVLGWLKSKSPELGEAITSDEGGRIHINLAKIEKLRAVVENLSLMAIRVNETGISIEVNLK